MLVTAVLFWQVVLAVHIAAVIITFGVIFAYPVIYLFAAKLDPRAMPWYYRMRVLLSRRLISPGLVLVLVAGIYLASKLHQWRFNYARWGLAVIVIIGGLEGAVLARNEKKLAALAEQDIAVAGPGSVTWSGEYQALSRRVVTVDALILVLVLITVYVMTIHGI
jgi:hypothetical protein